MLKSITSLAGAAIILATLATTVQAKQITTDTRKIAKTEMQKVAKAQTTQAPCLWLVLGVGY